MSRYFSFTDCRTWSAAPALSLPETTTVAFDALRALLRRVTLTVAVLPALTANSFVP